MRKGNRTKGANCQNLTAEETMERLKIFVEKASFLKECSEWCDLHISREKDDMWKTDITLQMLLPSFRMFVQARDCIAVYIVGAGNQNNTIDKLWIGLPDWWYDEVKQVWESIDSLLKQPAGIVCEDRTIALIKQSSDDIVCSEAIALTSDEKDKYLTNQDIFDTFFYGGEVHADPSKFRTVERWKSDQNIFFGILLKYQNILDYLVRQVFVVAEACKRVLDEQTGK